MVGLRLDLLPQGYARRQRDEEADQS